LQAAEVELFKPSAAGCLGALLECKREHYATQDHPVARQPRSIRKGGATQSAKTVR